MKILKRILDFLKEHKLIIIIISVFVLFKLIFLAHPLVSLEYMYTTPAVEIIKHDFSLKADYLMYYFEIMSNPLLTSLILIPGFLLFGFSEFVSRLPVLIIAILFLITVYWFVNQYYDKKVAIIASLLLALNPLFWLYSGQITTDIFFTFFVSIAILLCIDGLMQKRYNQFIFSALFLALAMLTKYIALLYYVLIALLILFGISYNSIKEFFTADNLKRIFYQGLPFILFFFILVIPYLLWMFFQFGFIMHQNLIDLAWSKGGVFGEMPLRFLGYLIWITIFTGILFPIIVYDAHKRLQKYISGKTISLYAILLALFNVLFLLLFDINKIYNLGELHFGGLQTLLYPLLLKIMLIVLLFCGEIVLIAIVLWFVQGNLLEKYFAFWILYSLFALSTARPTQRYLMLILVPFMIYLATITLKYITETKLNEIKRIIWILFYINICVLLLFNLTLNVYEYKTGYAAKEIADYLLDNNIEAQINFDVISHNYYLLNENPAYKLNNRNFVITDYKRQYLVTDKSNLGKYKFTEKFEIVKEAKVEIFGIKVKDFVVAKRIK